MKKAVTFIVLLAVFVTFIIIAGINMTTVKSINTIEKPEDNIKILTPASESVL